MLVCDVDRSAAFLTVVWEAITGTLGLRWAEFERLCRTCYSDDPQMLQTSSEVEQLLGEQVRSNALWLPFVRHSRGQTSEVNGYRMVWLVSVRASRGSPGSM